MMTKEHKRQEMEKKEGTERLYYSIGMALSACIGGLFGFLLFLKYDNALYISMGIISGLGVRSITDLAVLVLKRRKKL